jgi:hypothetical protein
MPEATMAVLAPAAPRAIHSPQPTSEAAAQTPSHFADVISGRLGAQAMDGRSGPSTDSGDGEALAHDLLSAKLPASSGPVAGEGEGFSEAMALIQRFARPSSSVDAALVRAADGPTGFQNNETATGPLRSEVFEQIVQRAAVQLRNDQGEMHIDLKPDFLGRVRMQILTENQQVSVRIFTERPAVRDLIETGLYQLKSDLQNQGLQVDRLEVAMSTDQRQHGWQPGPNPQAWKAPANGFGTDDQGPTEERRAAVHPPSRWNGSASIDMFV